jgi:hypothetical protein
MLDFNRHAIGTGTPGYRAFDSSGTKGTVKGTGTEGTTGTIHHRDHVLSYNENENLKGTGTEGTMGYRAQKSSMISAKARGTEIPYINIERHTSCLSI